MQLSLSLAHFVDPCLVVYFWWTSFLVMCRFVIPVAWTGGCRVFLCFLSTVGRLLEDALLCSVVGYPCYAGALSPPPLQDSCWIVRLSWGKESHSQIRYVVPSYLHRHALMETGIGMAVVSVQGYSSIKQHVVTVRFDAVRTYVRRGLHLRIPDGPLAYNYWS